MMVRDVVAPEEIYMWICSGRGGMGAVSFRRERYVPHGGPDGGDGGDGGDGWVEAATNVTTVRHVHRRVAAENGHDGGSRRKHGAQGKPAVVRVPVGTIVYDAETGEEIADLVEPGQRVQVVEGGRGGRGNAQFASAMDQAPHRAERGVEGTCRRLRLILQIPADVVLLGPPNSGKSSLLRIISSGRPEVADYPSTTRVPAYGVIETEDFQRWVAVEIPGVGEHHLWGRGQGSGWLHHLDRVKLVVVVVRGGDGGASDYQTVMDEVARVQPSLLSKPRILVHTWADRECGAADRSRVSEHGMVPVVWTSTVTGEGIAGLLDLMNHMIHHSSEH
jgi:GTP-binding protein